MKRKLAYVMAAAFFFAACNNETKPDPEKAAGETGKTNETSAGTVIPALGNDSASQAKIMQAWQDFATPGAEHQWMAKGAGTWVCDSMAQMMDPAAPPAYSKASETVTIAMNGLYQLTDFSSTMMGMPMQGHSIMGFDKMKKKYVLSWIDNVGSGIVRLEGTYNEATKTLNMSGKQSDPARGMETDMRQELKYLDDNTYVMAMYGTGHDGKTEEKFMQGTFKRVKK
jgi:Protein of unknown function (DUF1579)